MAAPTALDLLWGTPERPRRGPKPSLSLERIVTEAIALADAEGLANLSMQHLAERLGCAKMALYRYVPGKAELVALMVDAGLGDPPEPAGRTAGAATRAGPGRPRAGEQPWRAVLRLWATTIFDRYRAHPWAIEASAGARPTGPHELAWMETALGGAGRHRPDRPRAARRRGAAERPRPEPGPGDVGGRATSKPRSPARSARSCRPTRIVTRRSWRRSPARRRPADATTRSTSASTASSTASRPSSPPAQPDRSHHTCQPSRIASCYSKYAMVEQ